MAKKKSKRQNDSANLDMTPMIDVVFQLIIFFVVTLKTAESVNPDIVLADAKDGPEFKQDEYKDNAPVVLEVMTYSKATEFFTGKGCCISVNGAVVSDSQLAAILQQIVKRRGNNVPVMIRADKNTDHKDVRRLMDICQMQRLWKFSFFGMKESAESRSKNKK